MLQKASLLALVFLLSTVGSSRMCADTAVKGPFQKADRGATASGYPRHCHAERVAEQNAEYQLTADDMIVVAPDPGRPKVGPVKIDFCDHVVQFENQCPQSEADAARRFKRSFDSAGN